MTGSEWETKHNQESSDNGNNEQRGDDNNKYCDDNDENDIYSVENSIFFTEVDSSIDLLSKKETINTVTISVSLMRTCSVCLIYSSGDLLLKWPYYILPSTIIYFIP